MVTKALQNVGKLNDIVNVKDFFTTGDATYQAAAALAVASGADVFYPKGTFTHTATLAPSTTGQVFYGTGHQSVIQANAAGFDLFSPTADGVTFRDLRMNGKETAQNATVYFAIVTDAVAAPDYVKVLGCKFSGAIAGEGWRGAVKFNAGSNYCVVDNCDIERLWGSTLDCGYGVLTGNVTGCRVTNSRAIGSAGRGRHMVYFSAGATDCIAAFNRCESFCEAGFTTFSQAAQPACTRITFAFNYAISCCLNANAAAGALQIYGHQIDGRMIGNYSYGSMAAGLRVDGQGVVDCKNTSVIGNTVRNASLEGIVIMSGVGGLLADNDVDESSQIGAGIWSNIVFEGDTITASSNWLVRGNRSTGSTKARSAIQFNSTAPVPTGIRLEDNYFPVCNVTDIEVGASTAAQLTGNDVVLTFTPELMFGGAQVGMTTSTKRGEIVISGRRCDFTIYIVLTATGGSAGIAEIYNIPVNARNQDAAVALHLVDVTFVNFPEAYVATNLIQLQQINGATGARSNLTQANFAATSQIRVRGTYFR